jgi:hypothetical protein
MSAQPQPDENPELTAVEAALGSLAPAPGRLDRDRVMFQAGRAAPHRSLARAGWPALAACLAVVAAGEGALLSSRPAIRYVDRVVVVREPAPSLAPAPAPAPTSAPIAGPEPEPEPKLAGDVVEARLPFLTLTRVETDYERLRARVLEYGLDGLPEPPTLAAYSGGPSAVRPDESAAALLRSEVDAILKPGDPS